MAEQTKPTKPETAEIEAPLPPFFDAGIVGLLKRAQAIDPDRRHRMIKMSATNQSMKRLKGWLPLEDKEVISKLGFDKSQVNSAGRIQIGDSELWYMPESLARRIRKVISDRTLARHRAIKQELDGMAEDVKGRTGGLVQPFGRLSDEVLDRT